MQSTTPRRAPPSPPPKSLPARSLKILLDGHLHANLTNIAKVSGVTLETATMYMITAGLATLLAQAEEANRDEAEEAQAPGAIRA